MNPMNSTNSMNTTNIKTLGFGLSGVANRAILDVYDTIRHCSDIIPWVMTTMVVPWALTCLKTSITSWDVWLSNAPVGSSASRMEGLAIMARAMAVRCFSAGQFSGQVICPVCNAEFIQKVQCNFIAFFSVYIPVVKWQCHIFESCFEWYQMKRLEHKTDILVAKPGGTGFIHVFHELVIEV